MKLEEIVAKAADSKAVSKVVKYASGAAAITVFPVIIPSQALYEGIGSVKKAPAILKKANGSKALVVTDATLVKLGVINPMLEAMDAEGVQYAVYDGVEPNPSIENIEAAFDIYKKEGCNCIVGFGGGSAMDAAKVVACRVAKPNMSVKQMGRLMGYFPVTLPVPAKTPFILLVPTTAGTGAESTVAAVVSDHAEDKKYTVTDIAMRGNAVILDASLAAGLPAFPTAITAIDAMSHCIEGYIGYGHNNRSDEYSERGVRLIFENIDAVIADGKNLEARQALCTAAYLGGHALNSATTGYVHPFCHKIGAKYNLPHGRCIGAVLPIMLEVYGPLVEKRLAKLGVAAGVSNPKSSVSAQAKEFIAAIREFDNKFGIQPNIPEIQESDFAEIADSIMVENFVYPTKKVFSREEIYDVLRLIKG
ncbi:MAG: iron-containing alcohol dehydrogenase [Oscillospiraceae bacterium]|nr:iron-containing alcohol dehydrogenase [Oscillospiraceae bacterium]